ncbi:T-cell surface antigen CD2 isoform X3 [Pyxicephalus adspersus]|uniref:T-cell surface antigen CD2 isoform X3 n=1 Tax=Pyxicephalus adspersus TaxID=30357 RepID=UPI003B5A15C9
MSQKKDFFQLHEAPEALLIHLIQSTCRFLSLLYLPYFPAYKMTPNFSRPVTPTAAMCPLRVLLLWALLCLVRGNSPEEIFTRSGSDLLLPIRHNLTLNSAVGQSCDGFSWDYREFSGPPKATHKGCTLSKHFPNVRISENGSLIIHNVTPENDGMYGVRLHNSTGDVIQRDDYIIHVAGKTWEEIFTRPGSDLLLPIRRNLTLIHTDRRRCDGIEWKYRKSSTHNAILILRHRDCTPIVYNERISPNVRISENGSLTIHNVTPENDGIYSMNIHNSTGHVIQRDHYIIHVEVPVSVPVLNVSCHRNGSAEISCRVEEGTNPNIRVSVIGGSQGSYSASSNNITAIVESPGPWNITCSVENGVSKSEMSKPEVTCPVLLSDIAVNSSCFLNGSVMAVCSVIGSDPHYKWSLDGAVISSDSRVTLPPPVSGTLRCDVTNQINNLNRSINVFCEGSRSCLTCLQKSLIGGSVALLVTIPPLFIAHWYIIRGMDKKS